MANAMIGGIGAAVLRAPFMPSERTRYQVRNTRAKFRAMPLMAVAALAKLWHVPVLLSELRLTLTRADGSVQDYGVVSRRVVTTAGVTFLATAFLNTVEPEVINYHASGTGATAENITDTAMGTDSGVARATGTQTNPSAGVYKSVGTQTYAGTLAITEHGIFSASTSGTLWDRSVFSAVNVVSGDSITFSYSLTLTAGG